MSAQLVALGELLIDFTPCGLSDTMMQRYERNPGGAPANVAVAAARLGIETAFIGKIGDDMHGQFLQKTLIAEGVDISGLVRDPDTSTTLAFVDLMPGGERSFSFVRRHCGDTRLLPEELNESLIQAAKVLHLGTLSMTEEPSRSATLRAIEIADSAGAAISCDINYRAPLWDSENVFREACDTLLPHVHMLKVSLEEAALLTGITEPDNAAASLRSRYGIGTVVVTMGADGAWADGFCPAFPTKAIDTTGAGDCFWAAWLFSLLRKRRDALAFSCAAASLCVEKRGAIPAMPTLPEVELRLSGQR